MARRNSTRRVVWLAILALAMAGCRGWNRTDVSAIPRILQPGASLSQVVQVVNNNSDQITSLVCSKANLSGEGFPTLRTTLAFQKPNYFRIRAETSLTGTELDLGSNDQVFWFWMRRSQPPTLYFCRHDQFERCPARQTLPFEPQWLVDALGMPHLDPNWPHEGPFPVANNRLEIRTAEPTPQGTRTKSTVVDAATGCVVQQSIYDEQGRLVVTSEASQHRRDPLTNLVLPGTVVINSPAAQLRMQIDLGPVEVNRPRANVTGVWMMPQYPGSAVVDLCGSQTAPMQQAAPPAGPPMVQPASAMMPPGASPCRLGPR